MITEFDDKPLDEPTKLLLSRLEEHSWPAYIPALFPLPEGFTTVKMGRVLVGNKFVVKRPVTYGEEPTASCPTQTLERDWVLQPRCQVIADMTLAERQMLVDAGVFEMGECGIEFDGEGTDAHDENIGILDGKLVQFDW